MSRSRSCSFRLRIFRKRWQIGQTSLLPKKSHKRLSIIGFKLYLGIFYRWTRQLERCVVRLCTANKRLNLGVPFLSAHMHVDNLRSSALFHTNRLSAWPSISSSTIRMEYIGKYIRYSRVLTYRHGRSGYAVEGRYQLTQFQGVSGIYVDYCKQLFRHTIGVAFWQKLKWHRTSVRLLCLRTLV